MVTSLVMVTSYSQSSLSFTYDGAGNQVVREIICVNCRNSQNFKKNEEKSIDFTTADLESKISFYPNPVQEELVINWTATNLRQVEGIEIYTIQGKTMFSQTNLSGKSGASVYFTDYAQGMYLVSLIYNDGTSENFKIIKK